MMTIEEELLVAFADGELDGERRTAVERALAEEPELRARLSRHQRLRAKVAAHYAPIADEAVPERLTALLAGTAPGTAEIVDLAAARQRRARPLWMEFAALAATLVLGLFAGQAWLAGSGSPIMLEDGAMRAGGELAQALETRLASEQRPGEAMRIGVSFAASDGRFCRTFDATSMSGLACRGDGGWAIVATAAPGGQSSAQYRQAGSGDALILGAAQEMMSGEPLDAEAERQARDRGWRNSPPAD